MADSTKLILTFMTSEDKQAQYSYNNAKNSATASQVTALANAMIANTAVYEHTLVSIKSIMIRSTTESYYDLSSVANSTENMNKVILANEEPDDEDKTHVVTVEKIPKA